MYTIEWQKRGLPHSHMLIWLKKRIQAVDIDQVISAEIPNKETDPALYDVVTKNMIHGPCGKLNPNSPCMVDGKCSKNFPRDLIQETQSGEDGYPNYRRRKLGDGGYSARLSVRTSHGRQEIEIDNRWVVPYSPLLCKMFPAHINVESCRSVKAIKYICKYINKGSDQAVFEITEGEKNIDEIQQFQMGRYISSSEAVWRILGFDIHDRFPAVTKLSVHLENGQRVYFKDNENLKERLILPPNTTLTAFFELCSHDPFARTLFYADVPKFYTWDPSEKVFKARKRGTEVEGHPGILSSDTIGRVYSVHPSNS
jgi:hypothetical protein